MGLHFSIASTAFLGSGQESGLVYALGIILMILNYSIALIAVRSFVSKDIWLIPESMLLLQLKLLL